MINLFKIAKISIVLLLVILLLHQNSNEEVKPLVEYSTDDVQGLSLNQYNIKLGLIKITNDSTGVLALYENNNEEIVFLQRDTHLTYEIIEFQFYQFKENSVNNGVIHVSEFIRQNSNGTYVDNQERSYSLDFIDGFAFVRFELYNSEIERNIRVEYLDIAFTFTHITTDENRLFDEKLTWGEYEDRLRSFGFIVAAIVIFGNYIGKWAAKKAKTVSLGKKSTAPLMFFMIVLIGLGTTLPLIYNDFILSNDDFYFRSIGITAFILGIFQYDSEFIKYKGYYKYRKDGIEHLEEYVVKLYRINNKFAVVEKGLSEAVKRFRGKHIYYICFYRNELKVSGYVKGFYLESPPIRTQNEDKVRFIEWSTTSHHKMVIEQIENIQVALQFKDEIINKQDTELNHLKGTMEVEINTRKMIALEDHYSIVGVNAKKTKSISLDDYELLSKISGKTVKEIKDEEKKNIDGNKDGKVKQLYKNTVQRFKG